MTCIVHKYGGSSVADVEKLKQIARMIAAAKAEADQVAVVVSAMGKTTNNLVNMARSLSPDPPRREMDMLLSTGERITMSLLCMALHQHGVDAVSLTGSQCGIITNDIRTLVLVASSPGQQSFPGYQDYCCRYNRIHFLGPGH